MKKSPVVFHTVRNSLKMKEFAYQKYVSETNSASSGTIFQVLTLLLEIRAIFIKKEKVKKKVFRGADRRRVHLHINLAFDLNISVSACCNPW